MRTVPELVLLVFAFFVALSAWEIVSGSTNIWTLSRYFRHDVYRDENPVAFWTLIILRLAVVATFLWM